MCSVIFSKLDSGNIFLAGIQTTLLMESLRWTKRKKNRIHQAEQMCCTFPMEELVGPETKVCVLWFCRAGMLQQLIFLTVTSSLRAPSCPSPTWDQEDTPSHSSAAQPVYVNKPWSSNCFFSFQSCCRVKRNSALNLWVFMSPLPEGSFSQCPHLHEWPCHVLCFVS